MEDYQTIIDTMAALLVESGFQRLPDSDRKVSFEREYGDGTGKKFAVELAQNEAGLFVAFYFDNKQLLKWTKVQSTEEVKSVLLDKGLRL